MVAHSLNHDIDSEQIKETFARFGLAIYTLSVLETGLVHALLEIDFLTQVYLEYRETDEKGFDRQKYEIEFDAFMVKHFAQTMGSIIKRVAQLADFDDVLKKRIFDANARRNYLVHHYWRENAVPFAQAEGRTKMIAELFADTQRFEQLDKDIRAAMKPTREMIGIKDEWLDRWIAKWMADLTLGNAN